MSYKPRTLFRIIEDILRNELLLPHIQRPFVWEEEQMARLFDSLMRSYPIQTLLFWRTREAIKARKFMPQIDRDIELSCLYDSGKSAKDVEKTFVLDGQQRLQTLFAIFSGGVLNQNREATEAYFDATLGAAEIDGSDLRHKLLFSAQRLPPPYYRIRNLIERDAKEDAATIADSLNDEITVTGETDDQRKTRERIVRRNIQQLNSLLREEKHFWVEELDGVASSYGYRTILDIFVRVNSGGTKLSAPDLMFAAMKEGWEDIEEHTEETVEMLNGGRLGFDKDFPLKCLLVAYGNGAEVNVEKFVGARGEALLAQMETEWERAEKTFQQLRDFIQHELRIFSDKVVRSYNAFVPLFDYLFHNPKPTPRDRVLMRAYYNKAQLFNWFGTSTDSVINSLHNVVGSPVANGFPLDAIKNYFATSRGLSATLTTSHLVDNRLRSIILSMVYVECWGNSPFDVRYKGNEPHVDHIYPQYMLRTRLDQHSAEINDIGNLRFVGATDNLRKKAELPSSYFRRLKTDGVDIAKHLLVSEYADEPGKLTFDTPSYTQFRERRRAEVFRLARRVVDPEDRTT